MKEWIKAKRHLDGRLFINALNRKLIGPYNYYGVRSNEGSLGSFFSFTIRCAYKWLNRRGGKRRSFNWGQFKEVLKKLMDLGVDHVQGYQLGRPRPMLPAYRSGESIH